MKTAAVFVLVVLLAGCSASGNDAARITALQKQVNALSAKIGKTEAAKTAITNFDLQERCSAAGKSYYRYQTDVGEALPSPMHSVGFTTNYNKAMGQCFMEMNSSVAGGGFSVALYAVPQRTVYGVFVSGKPPFSPLCSVTVGGKSTRCSSLKQFDADVAHYIGSTPQGGVARQ